MNFPRVCYTHAGFHPTDFPLHCSSSCIFCAWYQGQRGSPGLSLEFTHHSLLSVQFVVKTFSSSRSHVAFQGIWCLQEGGGECAQRPLCSREEQKAMLATPPGLSVQQAPTTAHLSTIPVKSGDPRAWGGNYRINCLGLISMWLILSYACPSVWAANRAQQSLSMQQLHSWNALRWPVSQCLPALQCGSFKNGILLDYLLCA